MHGLWTGFKTELHLFEVAATISSGTSLPIGGKGVVRHLGNEGGPQSRLAAEVADEGGALAPAAGLLKAANRVALAKQSAGRGRPKATNCVPVPGRSSGAGEREIGSLPRPPNVLGSCNKEEIILITAIKALNPSQTKKRSSSQSQSKIKGPHPAASLPVH